MGQLMNIVGPLLLLGGAIFVVAKRCELLGMCGETTPDSGTASEAVTEEVIDNPDAAANADSGTLAGASGKTGCCECKMVGDRVKCQRHGQGEWFNPPAGEGGSNDLSVGLSLQECNKGCGSASTSKSSSGSGSTTGAGARASGSASIPKKPRLNASGSVGSGAGAGGTRSSSSSSSKPRTSTGGGARVNAGASFYAYYPYPRPRYYRSYFVDPNYVRPFNLYHRIAN
jgi:hypothetical protein